jgi:hypothetical protein
VWWFGGFFWWDPIWCLISVYKEVHSSPRENSFPCYCRYYLWFLSKWFVAINIRVINGIPWLMDSFPSENGVSGWMIGRLRLT